MNKKEFILEVMKLDKGERTTNVAQATEFVNNTLKLAHRVTGVDIVAILRKVK